MEEKKRTRSAKDVKRAMEEFDAAMKPFRDEIRRNRQKRGDKRTVREMIDELYDENGLPV